jgi:hypothetical protein
MKISKAKARRTVGENEEKSQKAQAAAWHRQYQHRRQLLPGGISGGGIEAMSSAAAISIRRRGEKSVA